MTTPDSLAAPSDQSRAGSLVQRLGQQAGALLGLAILVVGLSLIAPGFVSGQNARNIVTQAVDVALLGVGQTFVILTAGVDLSVASIAALSATAMGMATIGWGWPVWAGLLLGVLTGAGCGAVNGIVTARLKVPPFITTLGTMTIFRGIAYNITSGTPMFGLPPEFAFLGTGSIGPVPVPVVITVLVLAAGIVVLRYTKLGTYTYAIGGNPEATRYAGVPVGRYLIAVYMIAGVCAAFAGVIVTGRVNSVQPTMLSDGNLNSVAAVVIGGTSLFGGEGGLFGTLIGALLLSTINNGMNLMAISPFYQLIAVGLVVIIAVQVDQLRRRRAG